MSLRLRDSEPFLLKIGLSLNTSHYLMSFSYAILANLNKYDLEIQYIGIDLRNTNLRL